MPFCVEVVRLTYHHEIGSEDSVVARKDIKLYFSNGPVRLSVLSRTTICKRVVIVTYTP
jgi:hypothetical protein